MRPAWILTRPDLSVPVSFGCLLAAAVYATAAARTPGWSPWRSLAFLSGLVAVALALGSGLARFEDRLLTAHMVAHLLLLDVAPALMLTGRPVHLLLRCLRGRRRVRVGRALSAVARRASPARCLGLYTLILLGLHVPALFTAAVRDPLLHGLAHVLFLLAGTALWWPLLGHPNPRRIGAVGHLIYLTLAMAPMTLIGVILDRDPIPLYPMLVGPAHALGISAVADQQTAGAIMWVAGTAVMALLGLVCVMAALLAAERRQQAREFHGVAP